MIYISNLIQLEMYMVSDSDGTVWWDLEWEAQEEVSLIKESCACLWAERTKRPEKGSLKMQKRLKMAHSSSALTIPP